MKDIVINGNKFKDERDLLSKFEKWMICQELSDNTIDSYLRAAKGYIDFAGNKFDNDTVVKYKKNLEMTKSPKTVNLRLCGIDKLFEFLEIDLKYKKLKIMQKNYVENVITVKEFHKMISYLKDSGKERLAAQITILAKTGCRISEFVKFTKTDLLNESCQMYTKGKVRTILFPHSLVLEVKDVFKNFRPDQKLATSSHGQTYTPRGFDMAIKNVAEKCGIPAEKAHAHAFRHLFAVEFIKQNNNVSLLADLLGHSSIQTTMIYTRMSKSEQKKELDRAVNW